jgi:DNA-binding transcriptional ArsR family regulator
MTQPAENDTDPRILRALGDPVRQELLTALSEAPASAYDLSDAMELPLGTVRHHLAALVENDAAEVVDDPEVADDHRRYRAMIRPFLDDAHWRQLSADQRHALFRLTLRDISRRVEDAVAGDGFGHPQTHVSLTRLELDEQGWQEMTDLLAGVLEEAMEIQAESAGRRGRGEAGEMVGTTLALMHFGRPDKSSTARGL